MSKNNFIDQLKSLKHGQQLLAMFILLLIVSFAWIFLGIFAGQQSSIISADQKKAATPLTPQLDETILQEIENKRVYTQSELDTFPIFKIISIDRGRAQTIVPISFDENEQSDESRRSGSLESILTPSSQSNDNQDLLEESPSDSSQ